LKVEDFGATTTSSRRSTPLETINYETYDDSDKNNRIRMVHVPKQRHFFHENDFMEESILETLGHVLLSPQA